MKKLKILSVVGTRPEIIRLSRVFVKLDQFCEHVIVHTGQNYDFELNELFYDDLEIRKPDIFLDCTSGAANAISAVSQIFSKLDDILDQENPDAFLVLGDTNSCLSAIVAKRHKIPIFHMEAGNRCFDMRVPEEVNRRIVDHVSDVNLTYSAISREYLLREGMNPDLVIKTGSPMAEIINHYKNKIMKSQVLEQLGLEKFSYFLVSVHREENVEPDCSILKFINILNNISDKYDLPVVVSTHPRTKKRLAEQNLEIHPLVQFLAPFSFTDYVKLQINSKSVLSDSGTISEEASILNFPALNLREAHERPEAVEEGSVIMTGFNIDRIEQCLSILDSQSRDKERSLAIVADYDLLNVSEKILRIIHSYTDYVNRIVWRKY